MSIVTESKLRVMTVRDINDFWEASNTITEGNYERLPMDTAYDDALNISIGKLKTGTHKITNFMPSKKEIGCEIFTLESGEKIARGQIEKILNLCKSSPVLIKESAKKSALQYEKRGMRVIAVARGIAGEWQLSGFVVFHDPIKASALICS